MRNNCFPSVFPLFGCPRENRPPLITLTQWLSFLLLWIIGPMMALWPHLPSWRVSPGLSSRSQSVSTLHRYLTCFTYNDLLYLNKIKLSKKKHTNIWQSTSSWSESRAVELHCVRYKCVSYISEGFAHCQKYCHLCLLVISWRLMTTKQSKETLKPCVWNSTFYL